MELGELLLQLPLSVADRADSGQQLLPRRSEHHASPPPDQQRYVPLPLQVRNDAAYRTLRIAQLLCRPGNAPQLYRPKQGTVFPDLHPSPSFSCIFGMFEMI